MSQHYFIAQNHSSMVPLKYFELFGKKIVILKKVLHFGRKRSLTFKKKVHEMKKSAIILKKQFTTMKNDHEFEKSSWI